MYPEFQIEIEILSNLRYFYENVYIKSYSLLVKKKFSIKKAMIEWKLEEFLSTILSKIYHVLLKT